VKKQPIKAEPEAPPTCTFEAALARLEHIIADLENTDVPLEQAIAYVQEGDELARFCEEQLRAAEGKISHLVERLEGVSLEPMELEAEESE